MSMNNTPVRSLLTVLAIACAIAAAPAGYAQSSAESLQALAGRISAARADNLQAMKGYSWNQRTELRKDGEVISTRLELVRYDYNGREQRTVLNETRPKKKKLIAGRIQARKMEEMKAWGEAVKALIMNYTLSDPQDLAGFLAKASYGLSQQEGTSQLNARNVVQQGDRMEVRVDQQHHQILGAEVYTSYELDPVFLRITHDRLPQGLSYIRHMLLTAETKGLELSVENFNYVAD